MTNSVIMRTVIALATLLAASAASAHDVSQDWAYTNPSDQAHWCHHLRVAHWAESAELASKKANLAITRVKLFRARHARPSRETVDYLAKRVNAIAREVQFSEDVLLLLNAAATAKKLNCQPWP